MVALALSLENPPKPLFVNSYKTKCLIFQKNVCSMGFQVVFFVV